MTEDGETALPRYDHLEAIRLTRLRITGPNRNAMGEYIVPEGGKALTSLGDCVPSPSDYSPKVDLTMPSLPHYSIGGRYQGDKSDYHASPADNDTSQDLTWKDKSMTLKEKGQTRPYDIRSKAHENDSVGPAQYKVEHNKTGTYGPQWSVASRHMEGVNAGHPNCLVQPADTHGFDTPGPNYRPNSKYWGRGPKKSFGLSRESRNTEGPGPAEYSIEDMETFSKKGPAYSLSQRLPPPHLWKNSINGESPGPGSYELGTTVGKAQAKSITGRHRVTQSHFAPAPNVYTFPDTISSAPTAKMTYRPFEVNEGPHPSPTQYSITDLCLPKAPVYSIRQLSKPSFPDILNYPLIVQKHETPGPGEYNEKRTMSKNDSPKFSIGKRARTPKHEVPGPNHYNIKVNCRPNSQRSPAFSMGSRLDPIDKRVSPGPAAYYPQKMKTASGYSMTQRQNNKKAMKTPGPDAYTLAKGQTSKGRSMGPTATFKSRASPYVYSGFHTTNLISS